MAQARSANGTSAIAACRTEPLEFLVTTRSRVVDPEE
jgi:hypothetical protein